MGSIFLENYPFSDVTGANRHFSIIFKKLGKNFWRENVTRLLPKFLPSLTTCCRILIKTVRKDNEEMHNKKLISLAGRQSKPLNSVGDTVKVVDDLKILPKILEYLSRDRSILCFINLTKFNFLR